MIRNDRVGGLAIAATLAKSRDPYFADASASTLLREIKSSTLCPLLRDSSATAIPGKRCPPVPPQAITIESLRDTTFTPWTP